MSRQELQVRRGHMELVDASRFLPRLLGDLEELSDLPRGLDEQVDEVES